MAKWLRICTALIEDSTLVPSTHTGDGPTTLAPGDLTLSFGLHRHCTHLHKPLPSHTCIHIIKSKNLF